TSKSFRGYFNIIVFAILILLTIVVQRLYLHDLVFLSVLLLEQFLHLAHLLQLLMIYIVNSYGLVEYLQKPMHDMPQNFVLTPRQQRRDLILAQNQPSLILKTLLRLVILW